MGQPSPCGNRRCCGPSAGAAPPPAAAISIRVTLPTAVTRTPRTTPAVTAIGPRARPWPKPAGSLLVSSNGSPSSLARSSSPSRKPLLPWLDTTRPSCTTSCGKPWPPPCVPSRPWGAPPTGWPSPSIAGCKSTTDRSAALGRIPGRAGERRYARVMRSHCFAASSSTSCRAALSLSAPSVSSPPATPTPKSTAAASSSRALPPPSGCLALLPTGTSSLSRSPAPAWLVVRCASKAVWCPASGSHQTVLRWPVRLPQPSPHASPPRRHGQQLFHLLHRRTRADDVSIGFSGSFCWLCYPMCCPSTPPRSAPSALRHSAWLLPSPSFPPPVSVQTP